MITGKIFSDYIKLGLSVIPCQNKQPSGIGSWKEWQSKLPPLNNYDNIQSEQIACICGKVSGGLTCIDFDVKNGNMFDDWLRIVSEHFPELLSKLVIEKSPSGGFHAIYRADTVVRNIKLALNAQKMCTIETRGEGGYFVCYPSPNYELYYSDFNNIQKITREESEQLLTIAKSLNQYVPEIEAKQETPSYNAQGLSPFDDYNQRHDIVSLLQKHGWKALFRASGAVYMRRPGKDGGGISASWNKIPDRFYVFSTSTVFENEHIYKASAVYSVLEHNGDYHAAAKALYHAGYGDRAQQNNQEQQKTVEQKKVALIPVDGIKSKLLSIRDNGYQKGQTTGWKTLDKCFSIAKRQFTVITGVPSAGKSEFMDALAINLMMYCQWKFAVFSPENYPAEMHYHKLIEKVRNKSLNDMEDGEIDLAIKIINEHFFFIDALEDDLSLENLLSQTKDLIDSKKVDALIIDPWNEIELNRPGNVSESDFIGNCLRTSRKFARKYNIHLFIVAHPTKLQKNKDGKYPIPELWDISGSAHWRNKADNGICVHRDYEKKCTAIIVQKVKFKYFGRQGEIELYYDEKSGRYNETRQEDYSDDSLDEAWYR